MPKCRRFVISFLIVLSMLGSAAGEQKAIHHPLDSHLTKNQDNIKTGDLPEMLADRYIRVLTCMNRTNFFLTGLQIHGFEYSMLKEYEKYLNKNLQGSKLKLVLEFIPVPRDRLLSDLVAGYGDIAAAGLTITDQRAEQVAFTRPYLTDVDELLVSHKDARPPKDVMGLSGKKVFVRKSSSYYESLVHLNQRLTKARKRPVKIIAADENLETEDILEIVNSGAVEFTVSDSHLAHIWEQVLHNIEVHENIKLREGAKIAWAVRHTNPQLKASLDKFIGKHRTGTRLGNIFFDRYYKTNAWIIDPLKGNAGDKIQVYRPLFEKYARQYGFDWRLMLAMAFQESGLNHKKKSRRGAVGLMQIKPSTAADRNVGIKNIRDVENNIHAAVKYLDFIRNRYFSTDGISPQNQVRFSIAAYNAGPAKINSARNRAEKMNLDPNRWFRNVELAVLRDVGQETVHYVSNINKYYVIYKNALAVNEAKSEVLEKMQ